MARRGAEGHDVIGRGSELVEREPLARLLFALATAMGIPGKA